MALRKMKKSKKGLIQRDLVSKNQSLRMMKFQSLKKILSRNLRKKIVILYKTSLINKKNIL